MNRVISFGDSLSDRGKMYKRLLFGIIPLAYLSGLEGKSPFGRFTNQYTWLDHWTAVLSESSFIKELEAQGHTPESIIQLLLTDERAKKDFHNSFHLDNDAHVRYYGQEAFHTYCEGGATAANWSGTFTWNLARNATRKLVNTLENERRLFLAEEEAKLVTQEEKDATLITVFIGANDLITVNDPSTLSETEKNDIIEKAVTAQMEHIQALIDAGYSNFSLSNLPNLGLTPRFQQNNWASIGERLTSNYNQKLKQAFRYLQAKNNDQTKLQFNFYDIHEMFNEVYENPEAYGFDKNKLTSFFKDSEEFKQNGIQHAGGYLFWDEVHPTAKMHKILEEKIANKIAYKENYKYSFIADELELPNPRMICEVRTATDYELEQIKTEVENHKNKVIFVKNNNIWSCYHFDPEKNKNHYVALTHSQFLEKALAKANKFSTEDQYNLIKFANCMHKERGIYFYKDLGDDIKAMVIHKSYIPSNLFLTQRRVESNSYNLYFNQNEKKWLLTYYFSDLKGKNKEIPSYLAQFLKGKTVIATQDFPRVREFINEYHQKNCYELINLTQILHDKPNEKIEEDLQQLTKGKVNQLVDPSYETIKLIQSHSQGPHVENENHYIIAPIRPGYHLQYRDELPTEADQKMVEARRGTTLLVYFKKGQLTIGFCGCHGFREHVLDKFENRELLDQIDPQKFTPPQTHLIIEKAANQAIYKEELKDDSSPADGPFEILDNLIKTNGGYGFDEASLMLDFAKAYKERWTEEQSSAFFGSFFMKSRIDPSSASLEKILRHALKDGGERTRGVLVDLGWINSQSKLRRPFNKIKSLVNAYEKVKAEKSVEALVTFAQFHR